MRRILDLIKDNILVLSGFLLFDLFFVFGLWVTDSAALFKLSLALVIFSLILFIVIVFLLDRRESQIDETFDSLLADQDDASLIQLKRYSSSSGKRRADKLYKQLTDDSQTISALHTRVNDYEEYVEEWAHEIKTPIALLTLILDNHRSEMTPKLASDTEYIRTRLNENVDQMLQYARVRSGKKDYLFEKVPLRDVVDNVIEDYRPLLDEKDFTIMNFIKDEDTAYCDKRGIRFMVSQFVSNSIKYSSSDPSLSFRYQDNILTVTDNGIGVKESDMPFIFERGFTGDTGEFRSKATGMGLYLVSRVAEDMNLKLNAETPENGGFSISVSFPGVS